MLGFKYDKKVDPVDGKTVYSITIDDWAAVFIIVAWIGAFIYFMVT